MLRMAAVRIAVSVDPKLARVVRKAAGKQSTSAWLADAAERKLHSEGLVVVVRAWETEHGAITDDERLAATCELSRPRRCSAPAAQALSRGHTRRCRSGESRPRRARRALGRGR